MADEERLQELDIDAAGVQLKGDLGTPAGRALGLVVFAHGSGSSRQSPRNQYVAATLRDAGLATLLFDLLTEEEEHVDVRTAEYRFDIPLLGSRLGAVTGWIEQEDWAASLAIGYFGASTGAAAALIAAAERPGSIGAVVSRGGRPDLAGEALPGVVAPTLLIVGGNDQQVLGLNRLAMARMRALVQLEIVPGATHLFEEPGALERVAELAAAWFRQHLAPPR